MDFQRIILIAGVAIISYLMVLQWNQDYGTSAVAPQQVTSVSAYATEAVTTDFVIAGEANTSNPDIAVSAANNWAQMFQRYRANISRSLRDSLSQQHSDVYDMLRYYMGWVDENGRPHEAMEGKALRPDRKSVV